MTVTRLLHQTGIITRRLTIFTAKCKGFLKCQDNHLRKGIILDSWSAGQCHSLRGFGEKYVFNTYHIGIARGFK